MTPKMTARRALAAAATVLTGVTALCAVATPASARKHHRRVTVAPAPYPPPTARVEARAPPFSFYPNEIEGGVSGNLPFNNQIRKMKDPLNANGAGR